jgi:hypothetical protein
MINSKLFSGQDTAKYSAHFCELSGQIGKPKGIAELEATLLSGSTIND